MTALLPPISTDKTTTERTTCRLTGASLTKVFDLGNPCVSDFLRPGEEGIRAPLCVAVGNEWPYLPQLTHSYSPEKMYQRYHYRSGTNEAMKQELKDVVKSALRRKDFKPGDTWLDIASNDMTLLRYAHWETQLENTKFVGVDPSDVALEASELYNRVKITPYTLLNTFFSADAYLVHNEPASIVTCIAMFYDLDNPVDFLKQVRSVMRDDGLLVLQLQYAPMMMYYTEFDAICHEHLTYWSLGQLDIVLNRAGFMILDAETTASNGGSIRVYAVASERLLDKFSSIEGKVSRFRVGQILKAEQSMAEQWKNPTQEWIWFAELVHRMKGGVLDFLTTAKAQNKTVVGLGASTKGNTMLQYFGITSDLLPCIADRQPQKRGLVTAGSGIPIISEEEARKIRPDYLFVLPYHFMESFAVREKDLIAGGTKLVSPLHLP